MVKAVLAIMSITSLLALTACGSKDQAAAKKITSYLNSKYNETFVVDAIGGGYGTLTTNTLKAEVYPEGQPERKFKVEITKDLSKVWDSYMNVLMTEKLDVKATELAREIFQKPVWVKSQVGNFGLSFPDTSLHDKNMSLSDYLQSQRADLTIEIYIDSGSDIDTSLETRYVKQFADQCMTAGMKDGYIDIFYLHTLAFQNIQQVYVKQENPIKYYQQDENSYNDTWTQIADGKLQQSADEITSNFRKKTR